MKTKTVMNPVEIPVGYDLDKGEQPRCPIYDDHIVIGGEVIRVTNPNMPRSYILVKEWEPTSEKGYMVSNHNENVGTSKGYMVVFSQMRDGWYVDNKGIQWAHCWPIPADMIGE